MMWALGSILLIAGVLVSAGGFLFAALIIRAAYRRGEVGILAGIARFGLYAVAIGLLLCIVGCAVGGWHDVVTLLSN